MIVVCDFLSGPPTPPRELRALYRRIIRPELRLIVAKPKSAPNLVQIKKKTSIGQSSLSKLTRKGNTRKKYRGQGK